MTKLTRHEIIMHLNQIKSQAHALEKSIDILQTALSIEIEKDIFTRTIESFGWKLSKRASEALKVNNIQTIGELVQHAEHDVLKLSGFGHKSLWELKDVLGQIGLGFNMSIPFING